MWLCKHANNSGMVLKKTRGFNFRKINYFGLGSSNFYRNVENVLEFSYIIEFELILSVLILSILRCSCGRYKLITLC